MEKRFNAVEFNGTPNKKAVMGKLMAEKEELRSTAKLIIPILDQIIEEISKLSVEEQKAKLFQLDPTALEKRETKEEIKSSEKISRQELKYAKDFFNLISEKYL